VGPPVSGYAATRPALIGRAERRPLSPCVRLKDGPDSTPRSEPALSEATPRSPVRARCDAASVFGAVHSIKAEPTSPCSSLAPLSIRAAPRHRVAAVLPERARRRCCLPVSALPPCQHHLLSWGAAAGLPRPLCRVARSSPAAPPSPPLSAMPRAPLSSSTKVALGRSATVEPLPFLLQ
jgi:hypothetical protein